VHDPLRAIEVAVGKYTEHAPESHLATAGSRPVGRLRAREAPPEGQRETLPLTPTVLTAFTSASASSSSRLPEQGTIT